MVLHCYTENDELAGQTVQFDLDDAVELLSGERPEEFPHERVIRLVQLQTWIWFPESSDIVANAARLAATAILNEREFRKFPPQDVRIELDRPITLANLHTLSQSDEYRNLFDAVIAPGRGWSTALLYGIGSDAFNKRLKEQSSHGPMIADLIDYRLRAVLNGKGGNEANISHAVFFNWWPAKKRRSTRSTYEWWGKLKRSSAFIYLIEKRDYPMRPPKLDVDEFWEFLEKPPIRKTILRRFFAEYEFITRELNDTDLVTISVAPSSISVKPFSEDEIAVIGAYKDHYQEMN
jgi:hypothetical protein